MKQKTPKKSIAIRLPLDQAEKLQRTAETGQTTVSSVVRRLVAAMPEAQAKQSTEGKTVEQILGLDRIKKGQ